MHELSVAQNIIEIIEQAVPAEERSNIESVRIKVGEFSNIVVDSLLFSLEVITSGTPLGNAKFPVEYIPLKVICKDCNKEFNNQFAIIVCPLCGGKNTEVISGTELMISEIEIKDQVT